MSMLQVPKGSASPRSSREPKSMGRSRADSSKKEEVRDAWQENIHFTHVH
jgi:hypothetical protein